MKILVIGATGGTGQAIVREALAKGHDITALVRSQAKARPLLPGIEMVEGDARDRAAVARALSGCDTVISSLGTREITQRKVTVMSDATRALVVAMNERGVRRLVCITGVGAGDSAGHGGFVYDRLIKPMILRTIYQDKDRQEAIIRASDLDWVIVRPTVLTDKPATGQVHATVDLRGIHGGEIPRADVAAFVVAQTSSDEWLGKTPLITFRAEDGGRPAVRRN